MVAALLTKFKSAKLLGIPAHEFDILVKTGIVKAQIRDNYGERFNRLELEELRSRNVHEIVEQGAQIYRKMLRKENEQKNADASGCSIIVESPESYIRKLIHSVETLRYDGEFIHAAIEEIPYLSNTDLFIKNRDGKMQLYKRAGKEIDSSRVENYKLPNLFIRRIDFESAVLDLQSNYLKGMEERYDATQECSDATCKEDNTALYREITDLLGRLFDKLGRTPTPDTLNNLLSGVDQLLTRDIDLELLKTFIFDSSFNGSAVTDKAVANCILALNFARHENFQAEDIRSIVLSAFLQDIGVYRYNRNNLEEEDLQKHPEKSAILLEKCRIQNSIVKNAVLEHHERLDGSGIPYSRRRFSYFGQLVGIISEFYTIYTENRTRNARPIDIFSSMKDDVRKGRFNPDLFKQFAYSLL